MLWLGRGPLCHWLVIQPYGCVLISLSPQFSHLEDGTSDNVSPGIVLCATLYADSVWHEGTCRVRDSPSHILPVFLEHQLSTFPTSTVSTWIFFPHSLCG